MLTALRHPASAGQQRRLPGHGQPLAPHPYPSDFEPGSSRPEARAEAGDTCGRWTPTFRQSTEITSAAGAEHASGRLRGRNDP